MPLRIDPAALQSSSSSCPGMRPLYQFQHLGPPPEGIPTMATTVAEMEMEMGTGAAPCVRLQAPASQGSPPV